MADKTVACDEGHGEEEIQEPPPETRRTRSGRRVRTPAALLDSEAPVRTPSRRTRRSVIQEVPAAEETAAEEPVAEEPVLTPVEEKPSVCADQEPEPVTSAPANTVKSRAVTGNGDGHVPEPVAAETAPASSESEPPPLKKPRLGPKPTPVIPLGKPKSGRVWKDRSKQR